MRAGEGGCDIFSLPNLHLHVNQFLLLFTVTMHHASKAKVPSLTSAGHQDTELQRTAARCG